MITLSITAHNSCVMIGAISVTHMAACPYSRRSWATTSQNRQPICPSQMSMSIPSCYRSQRFILPTALGRSAPTHNRQVPRRRNNEARSSLLAQTSLSTHQHQKDTHDRPTRSKNGAEPGIEPGTSPILRESVKLPGMNPKGELYH